MSEANKRRINASICGMKNNLCPPKPIFKETSHTINQSNALRLSYQIINNKKKPSIVYRSVNQYGGRTGSLGGFRGLPKNSFA